MPHAIERLAADLADQRRHLLEQWNKLVSVQADWDTERVALLTDLEATAARLDEQERALSRREGDLLAAEMSLKRLEETTDNERSILEGQRLRQAAREAEFDSEHATRLAEIQVREESLAREAARLQELRQRWGERRRVELAEVQATRTRCGDAHAAYLALWRESEERRTSLAKEQRELAVKLLACERLRQELLGRAKDAAAAERRLVKLEQRDRSRIEAGYRELLIGQKKLTKELDCLAGERKRLQTEETSLVQRHEALVQLREQWEQSRVQTEADSQSRREELRRLYGRHERDTREVARLREEVELIARHLIGDEADPALSLGRQAA